jgi:[pyruvate, water dikinase]-phosphate phosphotransferase / [pyruvate, water dikinase] kinase
MTAQHRSAFFVSDRTAITAEMLGHSLLTQFDGLNLRETTLPFIDSLDKAREAVQKINAAAVEDGVRPIIISTLADTEIAAAVGKANALFLDCFQIFISPLEDELGARASHAIGRTHNVNDIVNYYKRMDSVNYTLSHDDGVSTRDLSEADIILVGVSRCGKTPTCLYLSMQFGVRAANYPLIPEDFSSRQLPATLRTLRDKLYGLTITPTRLQRIRSERRPNSSYSDLKNCEQEIREAETLMRRENIPFLDATSKSVEELATTIMQQARLERRIY